MADRTEELYKQETVSLNKAFTSYLIGIGAVLSLWFLSGLYYVIFR